MATVSYVACPPTNFLSYNEFRIPWLDWLWELVNLTIWRLFWGTSTGCLYRPDWNLISCCLRVSISTIKAHHLRELLKFRNPSRTLRSSMQSFLQNSYRPNTLYYAYDETTFDCAAPELRNSIPEHIKSASSLSTFKTALKTWLTFFVATS